MRQKYFPDELINLPSLHDCEISTITLKNDILTFTYQNLQVYDSIQNQNIDYDNLSLSFYIEDFDFSYVEEIKDKRYTEKPIRKITGKEYDLKYFVENIAIDVLPLTTLNILTSWRQILIKSCGNSHTYLFHLYVNKISFEWF